MCLRAFGTVLAIILAAGCAGGNRLEEAPIDLESLLPPVIDLSGWNVVEGPTIHLHDTLYEYLNGGAERYVTHGFRQLVHVRYQLGDDPLACVTLDVYDMGSELGAFGIYSAGRPFGVELREWGAEGYSDGPFAGSYRGRVFVHGMADDEEPQLLEMLNRLVERVVDGAAGDVSSPTILDPLPADGRIAGSERYLPTDLLGYSFLPGGVLATYSRDGHQVELFFSDLGSEEAARRALALMQSHLAQRGTITEIPPQLGVDGFRCADPILGSQTVVRVGFFVVGVQGDLPAEDREIILDRLIAGLAAYDEGSQRG